MKQLKLLFFIVIIRKSLELTCSLKDFSVEGAKVTTDFLEKYIMVNGVRELFKEVGKYSRSLNDLY